jgi:hypothetical protein
MTVLRQRLALRSLSGNFWLPMTVSFLAFVLFQAYVSAVMHGCSERTMHAHSGRTGSVSFFFVGDEPWTVYHELITFRNALRQKERVRCRMLCSTPLGMHRLVCHLIMIVYGYHGSSCGPGHTVELMRVGFVGKTNLRPGDSHHRMLCGCSRPPSITGEGDMGLKDPQGVSKGEVDQRKGRFKVRPLSSDLHQRMWSELGIASPELMDGHSGQHCWRCLPRLEA